AGAAAGGGRTVGGGRAVQPAEGHGGVREVLRREARAAVRVARAGDRGHARRIGEVPGDHRRPATGAVSHGRYPVRVPRGARERDRDRRIQGGGGGPGQLRHGRRDGVDRPEDELAGMRIAILAARQGWHTAELCRALAARGHEGRVLPYEALVARLAVPETVVCESPDAGLAAFRQLQDVIVKPLFGSMGLGMVRVTTEEMAFRVFRTLETIRGVYYVQRAVDHDGCDLRAFVVGGHVVGAMERRAAGWKTNLARGGRARA